VAYYLALVDLVIDRRYLAYLVVIVITAYIWHLKELPLQVILA